jgi:ubiquinone biosynthesis protein UbiJ
MPWQLLDGAQQWAQRLRPPTWLEHELHSRAVLLVNHVLMQEDEAMKRLARHAEKTIHLDLSPVVVRVRITAVGLLNLVSSDERMADLRIELKSGSWAQAAQRWWHDGEADVHIYGDVMLAAEVGWLREHVRWDLEEDLSRVLGDAPAAALSQGARRVAAALSSFVRRAPEGAASVRS